jgi:flagellin
MFASISPPAPAPLSPRHGRAAGLQAQHLLRLHQLRQAQALERLATGRRINRGADGPAALIAAETLSASLAQLDAEARVVERNRLIADTADAALAEVSSLLVEARRLTTANADSTLSDAERQANQVQIDAIVQGVDRVAGTAQFSGRRLLDGSLTLSVTGASLTIIAVAAESLGTSDIDGETFTLRDLHTGGQLSAGAGRSEGASTVVDRAIGEVATLRGRIGSFAAQVLRTRSAVIGGAVENLASARSSLVDADFAVEVSNRVRADLLARSTTNVIGLLKSRFEPHRSTNVFALLSP